MAWIRWLIDAGHDSRLGCRNLARNAGFTAVAILVLGSGIALSVAIVSVADVVLRRPLPIVDEARVVALWGEAAGSMRTMPLTPQHFERYRHEARTLQSVAGTVGLDSWPQAIREGDRTFRANLSPVTGNFFLVLGSRAIVGRMLRPEDDRRGAAPVAVISHAWWRSRFGRDPAVLGRRLALPNSQVVTVVGIAPAGLEYPTGTDVWVPFSTLAVPEVIPVGRLRPGVRASEAAAELRASFEREPASSWRGLRAAAVPLRSVITEDAGPALRILTAAALLLLTTACVNVSSLLLVRGASRRREIAVRRALGAGRGRIVRQLIAESAPLSLAAAVAGACGALELIHAFVALAPASIPRLEEVRLQGLPLGFATLVGCAAALGSGLLPALWLSGGVETTVHGSGHGATATRGSLLAQKALVVFQVTAAVLILFVAGLLGRTLQQLERIDTGFAPGGLAIVELSWPETTFGRPERVAAFYDRLLTKLEALPGVVSAAPVNVVPFTGATGGWDGSFVAEGQPGTAPVFNLAVVGARYFETLGVRTIRGRTFNAGDREGSPAVAIVSDRAAEALWPGQDPLGKRLRFGESHADWRTVVGVAAETRYRAIREAAPTVYLPMRQFVGVLGLVKTVAVRLQDDPTSGLASIRRAVLETDEDVSVLDVSVLSDLVAGQFATPRLNAVLVGLFAAGAVFLAGVGLYAVLAGVVRQRRRELAIRHAVGATPNRLRAIVLGQALSMCAAGLALGVAASFGTARLLGSVLYGVAANDPRTVVGVAALLAAVAFPACYLPARQATRTDAVELLRQE